LIFRFSGNGVIVFEDYTELGFSVEDPDLLLIDGKRIKQLVGNLATFHAICVAFQVQDYIIGCSWVPPTAFRNAWDHKKNTGGKTCVLNM
jgi:hypothetical protein